MKVRMRILIAIELLRKLKIVLLSASAITAIVLTAPAQSSRLQFEVASIKPNLSLQPGGGGGPRGDRFAMRNANVAGLIQYAFRPTGGQLFSQQIIGGPEWIRTDRYDIEAKMSGSVPSVTSEQIRAMVQSLLEDRYQMKWHRETHELPVYDLVVAKGGVKMRRSADQSPIHSNQADLIFDSLAARATPLPRGAIRLAAGSDRSALVGNAVPVSSIVTLLQGQADRIVFEKTGITGLFDFDIEYSNEVAAPRAANDESSSQASQPAPSLFTALRELGLRLEPSKAPLPVIVIDSLQHPTEN
jgi:uncharacterized protein (TIGR03435 family)